MIVTGISGAGKASALKAFEDLGFHCVDNLPLELLPDFAALVGKSKEVNKAAIVVDVREGATLDRLPEMLKGVRKHLHTRVVFLDSQDAQLVRRYSETRRPHPLGRSETVARSIVEERQLLDPIRNVADTLIDTSNFNVHELRAHIQARFGKEQEESGRLLVSCLSFGFKNGVPLDADMVFDVRFLPNPHFVPEFRKLTGLDPKVAAYVRKYPQTREFLRKVKAMMLYLLPHYVAEGKSYLTVAFGCTGGQHRSVMMAEDVAKELERAGYEVLEAEDGHQALERARAGSPDLALLDLQMPGLDGYGVLAALRAEARFAQLPVLALTASAMRGDREKILEAGFTDYLAKPAAPELVRETVARLLGELRVSQSAG